ncbi:MAG: phosphate ABC transporter permease PstA [Vallitalea sp.]|jgi:phosphate transport system permease protein|nr:phosphate ABC transporter permease PstA [Vallitalea sp.]
MNRSIKDKIMYTFIGLATAFTIGILLWIIGFVFVNGFKYINIDFLMSNYDSETTYVSIPITENSQADNKLGINFKLEEYEGENYPVVASFNKGSNIKKAINKKGESHRIRKGDLFKKIGKKSTNNLSINEVNNIINNIESDTIQVKVTNKGEGIFPMLVTTLFTIILSLLVACPIGIFAAIYLTEYAKAGRLVRLIRFATESLSGIPSIIFGLFGMLFFVIYLKLSYSILAGALTLSIILLPVIIRQTEESLKAIPNSYREGSLGLGATKLQTIRKVILPNAISGIVVAIILSIGRIVGESAALLLTAGTVARVPKNFFSSGATLTVKAYAVAEEQGDIGMACAIGTVIVILILVLNTLSKLISKKLKKV